MALAIFGITNSGLNLAATLVLLLLIVVWLALIVYTFLDARRRISDPFLVACATIASFFPYIGTIIYMIVRPPEFLEDAHERELEIKAAELRVRHLREESCPNCEYPVEKNYLRCPNCQRRLKDPCPTCGEPVDPRWSLCPYCETALAGERSPQPRRRGRRPEEERERERDRELEETGAQPPVRRSRKGGKSGQQGQKQRAGATATAEGDTPAPRSKSSGSRKQGSARSASPKEAPTTEQKQRSPRREPDPDPRQA
ncbi:MAG: zinc ribbon domain-containing protein [Actinobacteria bacterium]|nr:zinc ribbon domain-containing protein [Actinomycetota bacterium]